MLVDPANLLIVKQFLADHKILFTSKRKTFNVIWISIRRIYLMRIIWFQQFTFRLCEVDDNWGLSFLIY